MAIRKSSVSGTPFGNTSSRPSNPLVGQTYFNGELGCLEIYTSQGWVANSAPPAIPQIGSATYTAANQAYNNASVSVSFTPGSGGGLSNSYRATSTPGGYSGSSNSSPITINGLQSGVSYTFSVTGTNNFGTSASSDISNSIVANTVPPAPTNLTATLASATSVFLSFTQSTNGGSSITNYKYSIDGTNYTSLSPVQTSSPITISELAPGQTYTFYLKAINENGDSLASLVSNSIFIGYPTVSGGSLSEDSTYFYRTFTTNGTFTLSNAPLTADILLIGGGGGGGTGEGSNAFGGGGGGGGAGGLILLSNQALSPSNYSILLGAGGSGATSPNSSSTINGGTGTSSSFGGLQAAYAGGPGAGEQSNSAGSGPFGSGGGAGGDVGDPANTNTVGQGFIGGNGSDRNGGGGGGSGFSGSNAGSTGGTGGNGTNSYSTWLTSINSAMSGVSGWSTATSGGRIAAGGGGGSGNGRTNSGGAGGQGGGGAGSNSPGGSGSGASFSGGSGITNTGSGGGAQSSGNTGGSSGAGGSGLVIVRYLKSAVA